MKLSQSTIMPILMVPSKNTHDIIVGMMYVEHTNIPTERRGIPRVRELNLTNIPAPNQSNYIACNAVIFEAYTYTDKQYIPSFIIDARTAGLKVSVGYIVKMFKGRTQQEVNDFVNQILSIPAIDDIMLGWHVIDEPNVNDYTASDVQSVVQMFKNAQGSKPWPFNIVFAGAGPTPGSGQSSEAWWPVVDSDRSYQPDTCYLSAYINAIINAGGTPIISLDFYPYADSYAGASFDFGALPPWRMWRFMYEWFRQNYSQYQLHAVIEGGVQTQLQNPYVKQLLPGHVDMHQQINVMRTYGFDAIWVWGWGDSSDRDSILRGYTALHWVHGDSGNPNSGTERPEEEDPPPPLPPPSPGFVISEHKERWGEAVSNEMTAHIENILEAIPASSGILGCVYTPASEPWEEHHQIEGYWIQYHLATRGAVKFIIYRVENGNETPIKHIDMGFRNNTGKPETCGTIYPSVPGKYVHLITATEPSKLNPPGTPRRTDDDLGGAACFWNLSDNNFVAVDPGTYRIRMYVDGYEVGCPCTVTL